MSLKIKFFNRFEILNILYCIFPLTVVLGNPAINLNIFFIIIFGFFSFGKKLFIIEKNYFNAALVSFFVFIIITSFLNSYSLSEYNFINVEHKLNFLKSLSFLRFLLIFVILTKLIDADKFSIKYFFLVAGSISLLLGIDIIYQKNFGIDIFGFVADDEYRLSGFFGKEYIAGGYLQRFSLYFIFLFPYLNFKNFEGKYLKFYFLTCIVLFFFTILLTNNRTPLVLFLLSLSLFVYFYKKFRKVFILTSCSVVFVFLSLYFSNSKTTTFAIDYFKQVSDVVKVFTVRDKINSREVTINSDYAKIFNSAIDLSKEKKIIGFGIKSFRSKCFKNLETLPPGRSCSNHPHNYYLEILTSTGLIGLFLFILISFFSIKKFIFNFNLIKEIYYKKKLILLVPFLVFMVEIFPIRSSGAFFTTLTSSYFFILLAMVNNLKTKHISFTK